MVRLLHFSSCNLPPGLLCVLYYSPLGVNGATLAAASHPRFVCTFVVPPNLACGRTATLKFSIHLVLHRVVTSVTTVCTYVLTRPFTSVPFSLPYGVISRIPAWPYMGFSLPSTYIYTSLFYAFDSFFLLSRRPDSYAHTSTMYSWVPARVW